MRERARALSLLAIAALVAAWLVASAVAQDDGGPDCTRKSSGSAPSPGQPVEPAIRLTADPDAEVVNFGTSRDQQSFDVVVTAEPPLPDTVTPKQLSLDAPKRFRRVSDTLENKQLALPTFTEPVISDQRDEVTYTACLSGTDMKAGRYTGQIRLGGPRGVARGITTVTVNAKATTWMFGVGLILALAAALFLLGFQEYRSTKPQKFGMGFWLQSAIALGLAFGALVKVYTDNPSWGDDPTTAVFALVSTAITAAGVRSFLDTVSPNPNPNPNPNPDPNPNPNPAGG